MPAQYKRLVPPSKMKSDWRLPDDQVFDAGAFKEIELDCVVLKEGTSTEKVYLEHAAVLEEDAWRPLKDKDDVAIEIDVGTAGGFHKSAPHFLRYLRARAQASLTGNPVIMIDAVAKS